MLQIAVAQVGIQGLSGPPNTLAVGTVQTGAPGSDAIVTITGTAPNQTVNFTIPAGAPGADGEDGEDGADAVIPPELSTLLTQLTTHPNSGIRIVTNGTGGAELALYNPDLAAWVPVRLKGIGLAQALDFVTL